jgi:hypothetical protein
MNSSANIQKFIYHSSDSSSLLFFDAWQNNRNRFCEESFPPELMRLIFSYKQSLDELLIPALSHAANGRYDQLKALLDTDSILVLLRGNVTTPGGLTIKNTTLLECAIGAGDLAMNENSPGMAEMIMSYFEKLPGGAAALESQLEKCRICLDELVNQKAYDLTELMNIIKNASDRDVNAALEKKNNSSKLCMVLPQFRNHVRPKTITDPHIHYNYQTLIHAFELYDAEWNNLSIDQRSLFCRQVIGYLQRSFPAVDRFIFARGSLYDIARKNKSLERSLEYKNNNGSFFPSYSTGGDSNFSGPGFDVVIYGSTFWTVIIGVGSEWGQNYKQLHQTKISALRNLCETKKIVKHNCS